MKLLPHLGMSIRTLRVTCVPRGGVLRGVLEFIITRERGLMKLHRSSASPPRVVGVGWIQSGGGNLPTAADKKFNGDILWLTCKLHLNGVDFSLIQL